MGMIHFEVDGPHFAVMSRLYFLDTRVCYIYSMYLWDLICLSVQFRNFRFRYACVSDSFKCPYLVVRFGVIPYGVRYGYIPW